MLPPSSSFSRNRIRRLGGPAVDADIGRDFGADEGEGGIVLLLEPVVAVTARFALHAQPLVGVALGGLAAADADLVEERPGLFPASWSRACTRD